MTKKLFPTFLFLFVLISPSLVIGQDVEMADAMRSNGKIYVVVAVISVVLAGVLIYLMMIDRKLRKIENNSEKRLS